MNPPQVTLLFSFILPLPSHIHTCVRTCGFDCLMSQKALAHLLVPLPPNDASASITVDDVYQLWSRTVGVSIAADNRVISIGVRDVLSSLYQHIKSLSEINDIPLPNIIIPSDVYPVYAQLVRSASLPYRTMDTLPSLNLSHQLSTPLLQSASSILLLPSPISPHGRSFTFTELTLLYEWVTAPHTDRMLVFDSVYSFDYSCWNNTNAASTTSSPSSSSAATMISSKWSQLLASDRVMVCYSLSKGWLSPLSYGVAYVPSSIAKGVRDNVHVPNNDQLRIAHHRLSTQPLLPSQLQSRFHQQWLKLAPRLKSLVHGAWSPPSSGYFSIYPRSFETLLAATPTNIADWKKINGSGSSSSNESGILSVPTNVFGSSHAECTIISCLHDIAHDDKQSPTWTAPTPTSSSPTPSISSSSSSSLPSSSLSPNVVDVSTLSDDNVYHVIPMSNFIRAYDKYTRRYSKAGISESRYVDKFFVLQRHEIDIGRNKTLSLINKLSITNNEVLLISTRMIDNEVMKRSNNHRGVELNRTWIDVLSLHIIHSNGTIVPITVEHACARSLSLLTSSSTPSSTSPLLRSYNDIVPRSVSILPIAIGCQARCPFCFSHSSVSVDQPSLRQLDRSLTNERIHEVMSTSLSAGATRAVITGGGEPMMLPYQRLLEMIRICYQYYPRKVVLITNGYALTHNIDEESRRERLLDMASSGLSVLSVSHHGYDDITNRRIMNLDTHSERIASSWNYLRHHQTTSSIMKSLTIRWVCVLQRGGVQDMATFHRYLDWAVSTGVTEICFKELYVSTSEESVYHGNTYPYHCIISPHSTSIFNDVLK
jgi:organic radical activating enzyme